MYGNVLYIRHKMFCTYVTKCRRIYQWCREWNGYLIILLFTWFTVHWCYHIRYCCEIWGNTYKTRVQPLYIIQKRAIRICNHLEYRSHTKPAFLKLNTLTIADLVKFKSMVLMYKIYNNLMPSNILSYFCMVLMSHDHDTRQAGHFKNMYCRTTLKSMCLSIKPGVHTRDCACLRPDWTVASPFIAQTEPRTLSRPDPDLAALSSQLMYMHHDAIWCLDTHQ